MSLAGDDALLDALFLPSDGGAVHMPADRDALFLGARAGRWLHAWPRRRIACVQTFKPSHDALVEAGASMYDAPEPREQFPVVLVLPPRQREQARALFAQALGHAGTSGIVIACQANNAGARSAQADLERIGGPLQTLSKHKCRVFWTAPDRGPIDAALVDEWAALDAPRAIAGGRFVSRPGLFAWDRIDPASALLAAHLPDTLAGRVADLGAGYGYLASEILRRRARVTAIDLYEADARALEPARINLADAARSAGATFEVLWHDVTRGLPRRYDAIVSNPPFHQGRADEPELGLAFIAAAADALLPEGSLWLVANRHLPYESLLATRFAQVRGVVAQDGFKVIEANAPRR